MGKFVTEASPEIESWVIFMKCGVFPVLKLSLVIWGEYLKGRFLELAPVWCHEFLGGLFFKRRLGV